jgi:orotate phosphoribosyltransferase
MTSAVSEKILKEQLVTALREYSVLKGEFTLSSGDRSDTFIDTQRAVLCSPGFEACGELLWKYCVRHEIDAIGGPATGAIGPVCAAVSRATSLRGFYVKVGMGTVFHGPKGDLCGIVRRDDRVLLVEDTLTTGRTLQWAIDHLRDVEGIETIAAVAIVDRSSEPLDLTVPYYPLVTLDEILNG